MRNFLGPIALLLFLSAPLSAQPFGMGHQDGHFSRPETGPTATPLEKIVGHCRILPGGGNLITSPCVSLSLTLNSTDGASELNTRTASDGSFEFNVPKGKTFKIGVLSRFYDVVTPTQDLIRGQTVDLQLKQK
jgi:hypothetical protein